MAVMTVESYSVQIYIGGDYADAKRACKEFCARGLCVTVTPTEFVYTDGCESGVCIGLVNYPGFPRTWIEIREDAVALAKFLMRHLYQRTALVVDRDTTTWIHKEST